MNTSERSIEHAEAMVALERDTAIAQIRNALADVGEDVCVVCDEFIEPERKAAMPSAARCIACQIDHEGVRS